MKKLTRIEALTIALECDIEVKRTWWNPFQNVEWKVLDSPATLSEDQYRYLAKNDFIQIKQEITPNELAIFTISETGRSRLVQLSA